MGCFPACFGTPKRRKHGKWAKEITSRDQVSPLPSLNFCGNFHFYQLYYLWYLFCLLFTSLNFVKTHEATEAFQPTALPKQEDIENPVTPIKESNWVFHRYKLGSWILFSFLIFFIWVDVIIISALFILGSFFLFFLYDYIQIAVLERKLPLIWMSKPMRNHQPMKLQLLCWETMRRKRMKSKKKEVKKANPFRVWLLQAYYPLHQTTDTKIVKNATRNMKMMMMMRLGMFIHWFRKNRRSHCFLCPSIQENK